MARRVVLAFQDDQRGCRGLIASSKASRKEGCRLGGTESKKMKRLPCVPYQKPPRRSMAQNSKAVPHSRLLALYSENHSGGAPRRI